MLLAVNTCVHTAASAKKIWLRFSIVAFIQRLIKTKFPGLLY